MAILVVALLALVGAGFWLYDDVRSLSAEATRLSGEAQRLGDDVKRLSGELDRSGKEVSRLAAAVKSARDDEASRSRAEIEGLRGQVGELKSRLAAAENKAKDLAGRLAAAEGQARVAEVNRVDAERSASDDRRMAREVERRRSQQKVELERRLAREKADLEERFAEARKSAAVEVGQRNGRIEVTVASRILFQSGSDRLRHEGMGVLRGLADAAANDDREIHVVGHTDDLPIRREYRDRIPTNWDLAAARATAAARYLNEACKISADRIVVHSHGPTRPVAPNDTEEGRAKNRRIEILFVPAGATRQRSENLE